ncbi:hypothetical protein EVAR_103521_1 [Eumeta japonica]|uniref:Uncharacterized protein n=1 Tax=Eumeta variegata TaxID=151549 RepID=A0A4C1YS56_EUMVA|nr:hypothetical protein EVAR_103521_1 [Eumeta japonica]
MPVFPSAPLFPPEGEIEPVEEGESTGLYDARVNPDLASWASLLYEELCPTDSWPVGAVRQSSHACSEFGF